MQNRLDSLEFVVSENKVCNIKIKDDINHIVNRLEKVEKPAPTFAQVTAANPHSVNGASLVTQTSPTHVNKDARINGNISNTKPQPRFASVLKEKSQWPNHLAGKINQLEGNKNTQQAAPVTSEDGIQKSRHEQQRENRKPKVIISGKASNNRRFKGGPAPVRDFFLYRVDKTSSIADIEEHLNDMKVQYDSVLLLSNEEATYRSFRTSVPIDQCEHIMDGDIWPCGVRIRRYFPERQNNTNNGK